MRKLNSVLLAALIGCALAPSGRTLALNIVERKDQTIARHRVAKVLREWSERRDGPRPSPVFMPVAMIEERAGQYLCGDLAFRRIYRYDEMSDRWEVLKEFSPAFRGGVRTIRLGPDGKTWILLTLGSDRDSIRYFDEEGWHDASELSPLTTKRGARAMFTDRKRVV